MSIRVIERIEEPEMAIQRYYANGVYHSESVVCHKTKGYKAVGWDTPDYHKRCRNGELMEYTPWTRSEWLHKVEPGRYFLKYTNGTTNEFPSWTPVPAKQWDFDALMDLVPHHLVAELETEDALVQKAAANAVASAFDALTFLAELTDLRRLYKDLLGRLRTLAQRNWSLWGEIIAIPGTWLEYRYGIMPLVYAFQDLFKALEHAKKKIQRVSATSQSTLVRNGSVVSPYTDSLVKFDGVVETTVSVSSRGMFAADFAPSSFGQNPVITAWEKLPLSFVIDWVFQVGDALAVASTSFQRKAETAAIGFRFEIEQIQERRNVTPTGLTQAVMDGRSVLKASVVIRRPTTVKSLPQASVSLTDFQFLDMLALMSRFFNMLK